MDILRACPRIDVVSHVYKLDESHASEVIPTGILAIQFDPNVQKNERAKILNEFSLEVIESSAPFPIDLPVGPVILKLYP
jgi:hypothetical protein